ncbi:ankyrin repeat domain-containing protein [Sphingomonas xanthus]|nr:ankyrin repeat domain-containing protein [Sphingomonas xanthus]
MATPAALAQSLNKSEGEEFLKAVNQDDGNTAVPLIEKSAGRIVNYRGYSGDTALHIATKKRQLDWVGFLLSKAADPNIGDEQGNTPLHLASQIGFTEAAEYLLRKGAKVDATNRTGETPLIIAVTQRQTRMVEMLLRAGANPDKSDHAAGYSARDYAKRDERNRDLIKLIETVKPTATKVSGPSLN